MSKFFHVNIALIIVFGLLLSSCKDKNENFEIDLSDFKNLNKSQDKVSNLEISNSTNPKNTTIKNQLKKYQKKEEVLGSVLLGKKDPFSEEKIKVNKLNTDFKLTGFLNTKMKKYVFVSYLGKKGTITEESIGGINTTLLPVGAKVINIDPKKLKLVISFENEEYVLEL